MFGDLGQVAGSLVSKILRYGPALLLRRIYPIERLASELRIGFRGGAPGDFCHAATPRLEVWLHVDNPTDLDVVLDRVEFEAWVGQPIASGNLVIPRTIKRRQLELVMWRAELGSAALELLRTQAGGRATAPLDLYVHAYVVAKTGATTIKRTCRCNAFPYSLWPTGPVNIAG